MVCIDVFLRVKQDTDVHLLMFIHDITSKEEEIIVHVPLRHYRDPSQHIKEPQNANYCLSFFKNDKEK